MIASNNDTMPATAYQWHKRPAGFNGPCSICGYPRKHREHRAVSETEGITARWMNRCRSDAGWTYEAVGGPKVRKVRERSEPRRKTGPTGPHPAVREAIAQATLLIASQAMTKRQAAKVMGVGENVLTKYACRHHDLWQAGLAMFAGRAPVDVTTAPDFAVASRKTGPTGETVTKMGQVAGLVSSGMTETKAARAVKVSHALVSQWKRLHGKNWSALTDDALQGMDATLQTVRQQAGTPAILSDPPRWLELVRVAERVASQKGESLFPPRDDVTLTRFYDEFYFPMCHTDVTPFTLQDYKVSLHKWAIVTGDPPLKSITTHTLVFFRDFLTKCPGKQPGSTLRARSVRTRLKDVLTVLGKAGPPGPRNRDAAGLLERVPWIRPPRDDQGMPQTVAPELFARAYAAASAMKRPQIPGVDPADWWRALLVLAYSTGLRRRTLFGLRWSNINESKHCLEIPPSGMKSRRWQFSPLTDLAREHLQRIRGDRDLIFAWNLHPRAFHTYFHKLQDAASIPRAEHFGLHAIRRTTATLLCEHSMQAAQLAMGHTSAVITRQSYINSQQVVAPAVQALPQPWGPLPMQMTPRP